MRFATWGKLLLTMSVARAVAVTVTVTKTASHTVPSTLYGQMFEDINSGDGGLYAELLQNRAFQQVTPNTTAALAAWAALNGGQIAVVADSTPVSSALPNALQFEVPTGLTGAVGFTNAGYFGIKVDSTWTYQASFFYRFPTSSSFSGTLTVGLRSSSGAVLGSATTTVKGTSTAWTQVNLSFKPTSTASDLNNLFFVSIDGAAAAGQTINFAMFSLFPPTYNNRANGMRVDIAETLADMKPTFFRFPGGNNLGQTVATRWQWNNTVGPLVDRPGRVGDWGYVNTDGLGLLEYLQFIEDAGMQPIMAVWSGKYSSGFALGGTSVAEDDLGPYIAQAVDQINFVVGDPTTSAPAALRSSLGHPDPFELNFVEIGNEDFAASSTYTYRWQEFYGNLSAMFPNIKFLATSDFNSPVLSPKPPSWDVHVYQTPTWFYQNAFYYDSFVRDGTLFFEGEYATTSTNASNLFGTVAQGRLEWPTMAASSGEACFMTGLERNSDIVFAASYAPLLQHVDSTQWTPDLVSYDSGNVYKSTSYYVQQLFASNIGDQYLPTTLPTNGGTLHWSVTRKSTTGATYIKARITSNELTPVFADLIAFVPMIQVANAASAAASVTFDLSQFSTVASSGSLQVLTGAQTASNTPTAPDTVVPQSSTITTGKSFTYNAPAFSVSVITVTTE